MLRLRAAGATSQRDPLTGSKAIVGLILLCGLFGLLPEEMTNTWLSWAEGLQPLWVGGPRGLQLAWIGALSAVAAVSLAKAVLDHIFGGSLWKWLRFQPNPTTRSHHTGALIWLHGVGDSGAGFEWLRKELAELGVSQVKVVLPDAPMRALQAAGGGKKRAWFGLQSMPVSLEEPDDMCNDGLAPSVAHVHGLIDAQIASGVAAERVLVGGFSQGAALAAWAAAECTLKLGGVVLWSGYAPRAQALEQALRSSKSARGVPFVACHGDADDKVKPECGARLVATLRAAGVLVHAHKVFEGLKHGCTREQIEQLAALLRQVAPKQGERGDGAGKAAAKPDATNKKRD